MADFSQGAQGAMGGAMGGAGAGSLFGPGGALIGGAAGAVLGGLGGLLGDDGQSAYQDMLKKMANNYGYRRAPQYNAVQAGYSGYRQNQAGLIQQLESLARGEGPSAAQQQMRESMDRAAGAQAAAAAGAGGRGVNAGAATRQAMNNTAAINAQGARDAALARTNEQLGALGQLSGTLAQGRAADEGVNTFNAGQTNDMNQANMAAILKQLGLNDSAQLQALQMAMGAAGPGMGTQLMAGGASMMPGALQLKKSLGL